MPGRRRPSPPYERFQHYLGIMHRKALELIDSLNEDDREVVVRFFETYYEGAREHYWSIAKLFCHAMYIPMFIQIGRNNFRHIVYIDTHSGPGLAKVGAEDHEIVLGSPLIALHWPGIVASQNGVTQYRRIECGFDKLYFIDINPTRVNVLKKLVGDISKVHIMQGDANLLLPTISVPNRTLVYLFVDPYGDLDTQLSHQALSSLVTRYRADVMMSVFANSVARGLSAKGSIADLVKAVEHLFGPGFCDRPCTGAEDLCRLGRTGARQILRAYECMFKRLGYRRVETIPVEFEKGIIYYMLLAVKGGGRSLMQDWVDGYLNYINKQIPRGYTALKNMFLQVSGRQSSLTEFIH